MSASIKKGYINMHYSVSYASASHHPFDSENIGSDHNYHSDEGDTLIDPAPQSNTGSYQTENGESEYIAKGRELVKDYWKKNRQLKSTLERGWQDPIADYTGPTLTIYEENCLEALESYVLGCTEDREITRIRSFVDTLTQRGTRRKLKIISSDWKKQLLELENDHPNFSEVVDYLRSVFALASATDKVLKIDPMLFAGDPGLGKSMFAARFAEMLSNSVTFIRMETAQSNSMLVGSETFWSNAKHGKVLESLVFGDSANPVFYLDELDKVSADRYDPAAALYALLEPGTAKKFTDLCYPFLMLDASRVIWVGTCNNLDGVPLPLRSRFKIFNIQPLNEAQSLAVAKNIATEVINDYSMIKPTVIFSNDALDVLKLFPPRKMKQLARESLGKAIFANRYEVISSDISDIMPAVRNIGFC
jgi:ATP-dependent Lon protease